MLGIKAFYSRLSPKDDMPEAAPIGEGRGRAEDIALTAAAGTVDLAGRKVEAFLYDGQLPGKEIWVNKGDLLKVSLRNDPIFADASPAVHGRDRQCFRPDGAAKYDGGHPD